MNALTKQIIGRLDPKLKGEAYVTALNNALKPEAILREKVETQSVKKQ